MPRHRKKSDLNQNAHRVVVEATGEIKKPKSKRKNPAAVALGKLGGSKGGKIRAANLTPQRRSEIARDAAAKRWAKAGSSIPNSSPERKS